MAHAAASISVRDGFGIAMGRPLSGDRERRAIRQSFSRYRKFSAKRRKQMREMYSKLSNMSTTQRRQFLDKLNRWRSLSPEQRAKVRKRMRARYRRTMARP